MSATSVGPGAVQVTFEPPASNGEPVSRYSVVVSDAYDPSDHSEGARFSGSAGPIDVTGLTPGDTYWVTVSATNSLGTGAGASSTLFEAVA